MQTGAGVLNSIIQGHPISKVNLRRSFGEATRDGLRLEG